MGDKGFQRKTLVHMARSGRTLVSLPCSKICRYVTHRNFSRDFNVWSTKISIIITEGRTCAVLYTHIDLYSTVSTRNILKPIKFKRAHVFLAVFGFIPLFA